MAESIVVGNSITLDAFTSDGTGNSVDDPDLRVSIIDPNGATVVNLATPTRVGTGHYQYVYAVASTARPGAWAARWFGTIEGASVMDEDGFTVERASSTSPGVEGGTTCTPWATNADAPPSLQQYGIDPDDVDDAYQAASDVLYELTGRKYPGVCSDKIRPQAQWKRWDGAPRWFPANATFGLGPAYGWCSCHRGRETGCASVSEIKLPGHPVDESSVVVMLDGAPFSSFRLHDDRFLVRTDDQGWPCCQDMRLEDTEDRTFSIAYQFGKGPDIGGVRSAALLGTWFYAAWHPEAASSAGCKPPARATRITRAGTTIELVSPADMVKLGLTGIPSVDMWVSSKRIGAARRRATVMVPGKGRSARRPAQ